MEKDFAVLVDHNLSRSKQCQAAFRNTSRTQVCIKKGIYLWNLLIISRILLFSSYWFRSLSMKGGNLSAISNFPLPFVIRLHLLLLPTQHAVDHSSDGVGLGAWQSFIHSAVASFERNHGGKSSALKMITVGVIIDY